MDYGLVIIFLGAITGSLVQSTIGFGCGIIQMVFFPMIFDILHASAISSSICIALTLSLALRFRQYVSLKKVFLPCLFYSTASIITIWISPSLDMHFLVLAFGVFLIIIAGFPFLNKTRFEIKATPATGMLISVFSGITGGLFGIGGPLMAPYYLDSTSSKEEYIGTLQTVFACSTIISFLMRIYRGIYTWSLVPATLVGIVGIVLGRAIGLQILRKVSTSLLSKLVYAVVGISGVLTIVTNIYIN